MTLYMVGIGLGDEKDITVKGLEIVKKADYVYLESYTSKLNCDIEKLEMLYGQKIIPADRDLVENKSEIVDNAKDENVAFLVIGDVFGATTHIDLFQRAKTKNISVKIIHNASILTAVGETGLELYKFGKTTSIPFENKNVKSPVDAFNENYKSGLHTLFLLDLNPEKDKFMAVNEAIEYLIRNKVDENLLGVACCGLGSNKQIISANPLKNLKNKSFDVYPQCLIIPGKLHFMEEESINQLI